MNKNKIRFYIVVAAVLVAFCVVTLAVPYKTTECLHTETHDDTCGYVEAVEEILCDCPVADDGSLEHVEDCGYAPAVEGVACSHTCTEENGCIISAKKATFWVSFGFAVLAILVQLVAVPKAMEGDARSKFYGFPILRISFYYLVAQIILSLAFMFLSKWVPWWIPTVVFIVMLCAALVGFVTAETVRDEVVRQDVQIKKKVDVMRGLQSKASAMAAQCESEAAKKAVAAFAEELRFSDPVSSDAIADAEAELSACIDNLQQAIVDGNEEDILTMCRKSSAALAERNRLCKLNK